MKIKNKLIAGGLMSVVACALVGSITGTFAWYQYSTRATASFSGATAESTGQLQIGVSKLDDTNKTWKPLGQNLSYADIKTALGLTVDPELKPVTPVLGSSNAIASWKGQPVEGYKDLPAVTDGFVQFKLWARLVDIDYATTYNAVANYLEGDVYVSDITGAAGTNADGINDKISHALRLHLAGAANYIIAPFSTSDVTTTTSGNLDLDRDGEFDYEAATYDWTDPDDEEKIVYNEGADNYTALASTAPSLIAKFDSTGKLDTANTASAIGVLGSSNKESGISIVVTIWLEGWDSFTGLDETGNAKGQALSGDKSVWSRDSIGYKFNLGLQLQSDRID